MYGHLGGLRMKPQSCKAKGRLAQGETRRMWLEADAKFFLMDPLHPDDILITSMGCNGEDLRLSPKARKRYPVRVEVTHSQTTNVPQKLRQSEAHIPAGSTDLPLLFFRKNHGKFYVALRAHPFFELLAELAHLRELVSRPRAIQDSIPHAPVSSKIEAEQ